MTPPDLLLCSDLPSSLQEELAARYRCHWARTPAERATAYAAIGHAVHALVGHGGLQLSLEDLGALPNLQIIAVCGVGYDGVPVALCAERGIAVTHTPDVLTDDVADIALALVLMTSRQLGQAMTFLQSGNWQKSHSPLTHTVKSRRAGILGLGRIGTAIARRLESCGVEVHYTSRSPKQVPYAYAASLIELAQVVDFLIISCPGGAATHHLVNAEVLAALGPDGILINIARGSVIDEEALIRALESGQIRGAGLDVFANEPHVPERLRTLPQVVLLPHIGSATVETRAAMAQLVLGNLDAHRNGLPLLTLVPEMAESPAS